MSSEQQGWPLGYGGKRTAALMSVSELPPKPGPTGEPRPPRAPMYHKEAREENIKDRVNDPAKAPKPPASDLGPALAWYKPSPRQKWGVGVTGFLMFMVGVTLMQGLDLRWMTFWWAWAGGLLTAFLIGTSVRGKFCAVGADWLHTQGGWVRHHELKKATAESREGDVQLELEDHDERVIRPWLSALHRDHDAWDYIYIGITYSAVAGGAETNMLLHSALRVPQPKPEA